MKTSTDRILTTHTGSLPRPPAVREMLVAKDKDELRWTPIVRQPEPCSKV